MKQRSKFWDSFEAVTPFLFPVLGGFAGVIFVNLNPRALLNPMIWIPLGIFLGWAVSRGVLKLMDRMR